MEKHKDTCMVSGRDATMKTYLVTTKVVLYETWEVKAENKAEAEERYTEGDVYHVGDEGREIYEVVEVEELQEVVEVEQLGGKDNG